MASNLNQIVLDDQKQQPYQPLLGSDAVSAHSPNAEVIKFHRNFLNIRPAE
jgi:hypothetical protein